jgi:hypothetical protein
MAAPPQHKAIPPAPTPSPTRPATARVTILNAAAFPPAFLPTLAEAAHDAIASVDAVAWIDVAKAAS